MNQRTIKKRVFLKGVGVHSGKNCKISVDPAPCDSGIIYIKDGIKISANYANVSDTNMCTRITDKASGTTVSVIEHISAAFYGLGITNAVVTLLEGDEIPFMDGSSIAFVEAMEAATIEEQSREHERIIIREAIKVGDSKRWVSLTPPNAGQVSLSMDVTCDFSDRGVNTLPFSYDFSKDNFKEGLAAARTFGFFSDVEYLHKNNLALGASMDNTVVFKENGTVMNTEGMRYKNEPVRHKILDAVGDLSLAQCEIVGCYKAFCPGHRLNNALLRKLFDDQAG